MHFPFSTNNSNSLLCGFAAWPEKPYVVPVDENQIHRKLVREEDVHQEQRREVEHDAEHED